MLKTTLSHDDLEAAARAGILSVDQLASLKIFAEERHQNRVIDADEPFKLLSGFRDVFIAVGVLILAIAFIAGGAVLGDAAPPGASALFAVSAWLLAERVVKRDRLALSGIFLALGFVTAVGLLVGYLVDSNWQGSFAGSDGLGATAPIAASLSAILAGAAFYARFKVPFVLAGLAGAAVLFLITVLYAVAPAWTASNVRLILGLAGLVVFLAAMRFDMSDRARITRRADCGFWLHLLAAPLIVHSVVGAVDTSGVSIGQDKAIAVFALVAVLALVALIVDRRSMIVSALIYTGTATFTTISAFQGDSDLAFALTLFAIAVLVIGLGLLWTPLRRLVLTPFNDTRLAALVPPWRPQTLTGANV